MTLLRPRTGNMWAQSWVALEELVRPYPDKQGVDVTDEMQNQVHALTISQNDTFRVAVYIPDICNNCTCTCQIRSVSIDFPCAASLGLRRTAHVRAVGRVLRVARSHPDAGVVLGGLDDRATRRP